MAFDPITAGLGLVEKLIDRVIPDKEQAAKMKLEAVAAQRAGELKALEVGMSAIIMEAKSSDPLTSRARPTFLYVMYVMILFSIPMGILSVFNPDTAVQVSVGMKAWLDAIPGEMWALFGAGYLGYAASRTKDKQNILAAKAGSGLSGLFK